MNKRSTAGDSCQSPRDPLGIASRQPHPFDRSFALLSSDVYRDVGQGADGWSPLPDDRLRALGIPPSLMSSAKSGFHARLYSHETQGYVLAFRGTDEARDWVANGRQGLGMGTRQYNQATELAESVARATAGRPLVITGHSLGAGLAAIAALRVGVPAVTFNAAGVHSSTLESFGIPRESGRTASQTGHIRRYTVDNDILTALQEQEPHVRHVLPDPIGHRIRLPDPDPLSFLSRMRPDRKLAHALEAHSMDTVIRAMDAPTGPEGRSHPGAALVAQSIRALHRLEDVRRIANLPGHELINAAAFLAARARESGMSSIDHVASSTDGSRLFAIQGSPQDPAQRRASVDIAAAASSPAHCSAAAIRPGVPDASAPPLVPRVDWQQAHYVLGH